MSIDLKEISGLPVSLDDSYALVFDGEIPEVRPDVRTTDQARHVLWNMTATQPHELYFMYRGLLRANDRALFHARRIRYDITVIVPGTVGDEYVKTVGHYHPEVLGTGVPYPEVYEVLHGKAHYLLQKVDESGPAAKDVVIVEALPGDKVLIPPGYGHVTINPGDEPLVMSNLIEYEFKSIYGPMVTAHGASVYELDHDGTPVLVENDHYTEVVQPRLVRPKEFEALGLLSDKPLYTAFLEDYRKFDYLVKPHLYADALMNVLA